MSIMRPPPHSPSEPSDEPPPPGFYRHIEQNTAQLSAALVLSYPAQRRDALVSQRYERVGVAGVEKSRDGLERFPGCHRGGRQSFLRTHAGRQAGLVSARRLQRRQRRLETSLRGRVRLDVLAHLSGGDGIVYAIRNDGKLFCIVTSASATALAVGWKRKSWLGLG